MTESQSIQKYSRQTFLPFHLADPAGILFFGHVFSLVHETYEHFVMTQLGYAWKEWFENPDWILPIKHAESEFMHSLRAGQECLIELTVDTVTTSSFTLATRLLQPDVCCLVKTVHVFCDKLSKKKIPIPADILSRLISQSHQLTPA